MIEAGYIGRKGKGGFYRRVEQAGSYAIEAIDLKSGDYRPRRRPPKEAARSWDCARFSSTDERANRYAWRVLSEMLRYAAVSSSISPTICSRVDEAMRLGYNWRHGPFEMIDALGTGLVRRPPARRRPRRAGTAREGRRSPPLPRHGWTGCRPVRRRRLCRRAAACGRASSRRSSPPRQAGRKQRLRQPMGSR